MKLLFDLGNTRLKWALWNGVALTQSGVLTHADSDFEACLIEQLRTFPKVESAWLASVASEQLASLITCRVHDIFGLQVNIARTRSEACGVRIAYADPARLGVDRFLNLIAVRSMQRTPLVVAACGTAFVFDALNNDGVHLGGLIMPSPEWMRHALFEAAAQVQLLEQGSVMEIATNTEDAVQSGSWLAAAALLERFVRQCSECFGQTPQLVLTGGSGAFLQTVMDGIGRVEPDLVLHGLARYSDSLE